MRRGTRCEEVLFEWPRLYLSKLVVGIAAGEFRIVVAETPERVTPSRA